MTALLRFFRENGPSCIDNVIEPEKITFSPFVPNNRRGKREKQFKRSIYRN